MLYVLWFIFIVSSSAVIYHHIIYPLLLTFFSKNKTVTNELIAHTQRYYQRHENDIELPTVTIVIPAHNEQNVIIEKLTNLQLLDYPREKLQVMLLCDGCEDDTQVLARAWVKTKRAADFNVKIVTFENNLGKVAMLNYSLQHVESELIFFSDASALISVDALLIVASHFVDPKMGVVAANYQLLSSSHYAESLYWRYQTQVKKGEAAMGAPIGAHGSGYCIRAIFADELPLDTINDDLILPLNLVNKGYRAVYEPRIVTVETEPTSLQHDLERRKRISAGNWQQILRLKSFLHPRFGGISFNFISGKLLRVFMPLALILILLSSVGLLFYHSWFSILVIGQLAFYAAAWAAENNATLVKYRWLAVIHYFVYGHFITMVGLYRYYRGYYKNPWQRVVQFKGTPQRFIHPFVQVGKWLTDKCAAILGLLLIVLVYPILSVLIKLDSKGPVLHKQLRVGRQWPDHTELFKIIKFRTMYVDAEQDGTARWASKNDIRVTRVGRFLRKTRIDELPQLMNVLSGEMSLFGPRPERPMFYAKLEKEIPFFTERVYGITPGITGLAQVLVGYDQSIEDARRKVAFDHAYAFALTKPWQWIKMETYVAILTIKTIIFSKGH